MLRAAQVGCRRTAAARRRRQTNSEARSGATTNRQNRTV